MAIWRLAEQPVGILLGKPLRDMPLAPHDSGKTATIGQKSQKGGETLDLIHVKEINPSGSAAA